MAARADGNATAAHWVPRWALWSVIAGLVVTIGVDFTVDSLTADEPLDRAHLDLYVLLPLDDVDGLEYVASFLSVDLSFDPRSGAESALVSIFSDVDIHPDSVNQAVGAWTPGHGVVVSELLTFDTPGRASDFLQAVWTDRGLGALERQRGPDGSFVLFHPEYDGTAGAPVVPLGVVAWPFGRDVVMISYVGAESAAQMLDLAELVEARRSGQGGA